MAADSTWQIDEQWDVMQHSGATVYRQEISRGVYLNEGGWIKYDNVFRLAAERGITIVPYLYHLGGSISQGRVPSPGPGKNRCGCMR